MSGSAKCGRTLAVCLIVISALFCVTNGAISVKNNRRYEPRKIDIREARQFLKRHKRAASDSQPSTPTNQQQAVLRKEVVLNGTENHPRAYVHWSGKKNNDVIFLLTVEYNYSRIEDSQLWRSDDYGTSYKKYSFGKDARVSYFYVSHANPAKMVFVDMEHQCMYTTIDELHTHHNRSMPVSSDDLYLHPDQEDSILLYDYKTRKLYVSLNFGVNWTLLQEDVYDFDWAYQEFEDPRVVHIEVHPQGSEDAYYKRCTVPYCNATGDGIDTQLGPFLTYSMRIINEFIFVQRVLMDGKESHMLVSHMRQNFSNAYFPNNVKTQDFLVLDASEGQVLLAVNHGERMGASLYLSDPTGQFYVLSLSDVHHRSFGRWFDVDLHRVKGQNGTYLANQQTKSSSNRLTSLISFNKGGSWLHIPSPKGNNCKTDKCPLVLRLDMDSYFTDWILSEKNAPGFIVAHGHYGNVYDVYWNNLTVFTSSDGGWTWKESPLKGVYHFNILDQGSIVTAIKTGYRENSSKVHYSYNEGQSWHGEPFRNETLYVRGVFNEPSINTVVLSVYGHVNRSSPWTMVKLDFTKLLSRSCADEDYRYWMPGDHDNTTKENCLLGQEVKYKRKLPAVRCQNGRDFERKIQINSCPCAEEDFECDFGFTMDKDGNCKQESWFDDAYIAPECTENQVYNKSSGYRRVGSDKCTGGVANDAKYKVDSTAQCKLVKPGQLLLTANATVVASGQPVLFHLLQKRGSVHTTQYVWDFSSYRNQTVVGLHSALHQIHTFYGQGLFTVMVTATNGNGSTPSNAIKIRVEYPVRQVAVYNPWAVRKGVAMTVAASSNVWYKSNSSLHYLYRFGDEAEQSKEMLTYAWNVTHVYSKPGTYTISVTAVNSISAATKQNTITVIDDGIVAQMTFSPNVDRLFGRPGYYYYEGVSFWLELFRQEMTTMVGVNLDRMALSLNSSSPVRLDCLILPKPDKAPDNEMTAEQISHSLVDMVDTETLSLFRTSPYIKWFGEINVTHITIMDFSGSGSGSGNKSSGNSSSGNSTGPGDHNGDHGGDKGSKGKGVNLHVIAIAVPTVALALIFAGVLIVCYRRRSRGQRYSLLNQDGAADPFFDEDDDLPLDMADARDSGRSQDDPILDLRS